MLRRYVFGPGLDEPIVWYEGSGLSDRRWLHADERGSVIAVSNGSGTVTNINSYDEQGIPASGNSGRFQYTGQQWISEFGMYHYRARTYSPTLGRFLQTDPIGFGGGMNIYAYVFNDPVNFTDPSGLCGFFGRVKTTIWPGGKVTRDVLSAWMEGCPLETGSGPTSYFSGEANGSGSNPAHRPNSCVASFGGRLLSNSGVRDYDLRDVEFRRGLDSDAGLGTIVAYSSPNVGAVTQGNTVYVNPNHWGRFTDPGNSEFWEEVYHAIQQQNTSLFLTQYLASSAAAGATGGDMYTGNAFERQAKNWAQTTAAQYRRERPCPR